MNFIQTGNGQNFASFSGNGISINSIGSVFSSTTIHNSKPSIEIKNQKQVFISQNSGLKGKYKVKITITPDESDEDSEYSYVLSTTNPEVIFQTGCTVSSVSVSNGDVKFTDAKTDSVSVQNGSVKVEGDMTTQKVDVQNGSLKTETLTSGNINVVNGSVVTKTTKCSGKQSIRL